MIDAEGGGGAGGGGAGGGVGLGVEGRVYVARQWKLSASE